MKSKIAIITTHRANNFGAVFQAFALAKAIESSGAVVEILDWRTPHYEWQYHKAWRIYRNPIPALQRFWHFLYSEKKTRKYFDEFRKLMPLSEPVFSKKELIKKSRKYDVFIVGSDQVWNPAITAIKAKNFDRVYLLDFVEEDKKKNAYAASIGVSGIQPESLVSEFKKAWQSFNIITMREIEGSQFVESIAKRPAPVVLDPVLLHNREFWLNCAAPKGDAENRYVFLYNVRGEEWLYEQAKRYALKHSLKLIDVMIPGHMKRFAAETMPCCPRVFLRYLADANIVFTNSFHALALSVVFGKKLFLQQAIGENAPNTRISTLLKHCNLDEISELVEANKKLSFLDCAKADAAKMNDLMLESYSVLGKMVKVTR